MLAIQLARYTRLSLHMRTIYSHVEPYLFSWEETPGIFADSTVNLLRSPTTVRCPVCNCPGLCAGSAVILRTVRIACQVPYLYNVHSRLFCWFGCDPGPSARLTMHYSVQIWFINPRSCRGQRFIVVIWFVCLSVRNFWACSPGYQSGALTAWIAFTQQLILLVLIVADFDVKALLSNKTSKS